MHTYLLLSIKVYLNNTQFLTGQQSLECRGISEFATDQELCFQSFHVAYVVEKGWFIANTVEEATFN